MAKTKNTDYEKLGRSLKTIFESGYANQWRVYKINFIRGVFFGLGVTLGGTIVVAFLIWFLSLFTQLPLIGNFVDTVSDSIESNPQ